MLNRLVEQVNTGIVKPPPARKRTRPKLRAAG
jgi:hypothetical protein